MSRGQGVLYDEIAHLRLEWRVYEDDARQEVVFARRRPSGMRRHDRREMASPGFRDPVAPQIGRMVGRGGPSVEVATPSMSEVLDALDQG
jgi:hypothetical protein